MKSKIATLLQQFGAKIGLGSSLVFSEEGTVRLNLKENFGLDFQEDLNGEKVWIYCDLFPGSDMTEKENLFKLLQFMFSYHRLLDARLAIDPQGFQIYLITSFEVHDSLLEEDILVDLLDEHLKKLVALAEKLRKNMVNS